MQGGSDCIIWLRSHYLATREQMSLSWKELKPVCRKRPLAAPLCSTGWSPSRPTRLWPRTELHYTSNPGKETKGGITDHLGQQQQDKTGTGTKVIGSKRGGTPSRAHGPGRRAAEQGRAGLGKRRGGSRRRRAGWTHSTRAAQGAPSAGCSHRPLGLALPRPARASRRTWAAGPALLPAGEQQVAVHGPAGSRRRLRIARRPQRALPLPLPLPLPEGKLRLPGRHGQLQPRGPGERGCPWARPAREPPGSPSPHPKPCDATDGNGLQIYAAPDTVLQLRGEGELQPGDWLIGLSLTGLVQLWREGSLCPSLLSSPLPRSNGRRLPDPGSSSTGGCSRQGKSLPWRWSGWRGGTSPCITRWVSVAAVASSRLCLQRGFVSWLTGGSLCFYTENHRGDGHELKGGNR